MKFQYIGKAISVFESIVEGDEVEVVPCTLEEVTELETLLSSSYSLPAAYKEFLLYGGKKMAGLFRTANLSYNMAKLLLKDRYRCIVSMIRLWEHKDHLSSEIFVLTEHLGSNMHYLKLTEGNNPPVYFWEEGEGGLEVSEIEAETFSDFLIKEIEVYGAYGHQRYLKRIAERKENH